ncbi:MAG: cell division protease FtsH [Microgenomates group bacterium Gr01-1014_7]|nr:MAG: cell division protease FtsH [Microgenomates group bacterium Gr01-1014_7]
MANGKRKVNLNKRIAGVLKGLAIYALIAFAALMFFYQVSGPPPAGNEMPISQIINDIKDNKIQKLSLEGTRVTAEYKEGGQKLLSHKEEGESIYKILESSGVDPKSVTIEVRDLSMQQAWAGVISAILPVLLLVGLMFLLFRNAREAGQGIFNFAQSRARLFTKDAPQIKFSDVAGANEAKKELEEIVDFLKNPAKYKEMGARIPKGVLLVGPPGCGKTLISRSVAGEANVPFYSIAGSEFMEMLVGVGAARVRDMFATAKKNSPSIIFIDEIESIGRMRGMGMVGGGHDEREQTLNQILVEMDGFTPNDHVIVMGASNRPDMLDPALIRPGRFDRRVVMNMPDIEERKFIIKLHMKGKPFTEDVDVERLARRTVGFSGADLSNMLNEAAILAAREGKKAIDPLCLEEAATKVKLGPQRKRMQTEEDRKLAAYHEGGHAIVGHNLPKVDPVHRITIVARGMIGGHTTFPPTEDRSNETRSRLLEQISTALGGRAAEDMIFKDISTGAANDLELATAIARDMVTEYGMSALGPINIKPHPMFGLWARMQDEGGGVSQAMQSKIDNEIKKIIDSCYKQAVNILHKNKPKLDKVAEALLEKETLDTDEFEKLVGKKKS